MANDTLQVVWFEELRRTDVPRVGGKNASLGEMVANLASRGVNVPPGFALTADAYWRFIDANGLDTLSLSRQERYSFRNHSESDNDARTVQVCIRLSKSSDNAVSAPFRWAEVHEENLIVVMMDDGAQSLTATHQIGGRELALKHGKLKMVSKPAH